jgi:hypothetical protein
MGEANVTIKRKKKVSFGHHPLLYGVTTYWKILKSATHPYCTQYKNNAYFFFFSLIAHLPIQ